METLTPPDKTRALASSFHQWPRSGGRRRAAQPTPIVAMTAHAMAVHCEHCLATGMDNYNSPPLQKAELSALLARTSAGSLKGVLSP